MQTFTGLIPLLIMGFVAYFFWRSFTRKNSPTARLPVSVPAAFSWPKLDEYEFDIVGEGPNQFALKRLAGEHGQDAAEVYTTAVLVPYATNPHDDKAVRVDIDGWPVGHLSREDARSFRRRLGAKKLGAASTSCGALIMGGFTNRQGEVASYGVRLDIKPFE